METYLHCGSSKLIAKHGLSVRVVVEEANCGCATCVDVTLDVGSVALEGIVIRRIGSRAESGGQRRLGIARGLVYKR